MRTFPLFQYSKPLCFSLILMYQFLTPVKAQILYGGVDDAGGNDFIMVLDLSSCSTCLGPAICGTGQTYELEVMSTGNFLVANGGLSICSAAGGILQDLGVPGYQAVGIGGGLYYYSGFTGVLGLYNANTGTTQTIGSLPPNFLLSSGGDFFYVNGTLYALGLNLTNFDWEIYQINVMNPSASTFVTAPPVNNPQGVATVGNDIYILDWPGGGSMIYNYDLANNTLTAECYLSNIFLYSLGGLPSTVTPLTCNCSTNAGSMTIGTANVCTNAIATLAHNGNQQLESDDLLQFILFSNPADTLGSILVQSNSNSFSFDPLTMVPNTSYYVAAIAGNNVNGNVDLTDPCLDVSNAPELIWRPVPSVSFQASSTPFCEGECQTITATFTGTPPFTFNYSSPGGSGTSIPFSDFVGNFQYCPLPGTPSGPLLLQATSVSDLWCTCQ